MASPLVATPTSSIGPRPRNPSSATIHVDPPHSKRAKSTPSPRSPPPHPPSTSHASSSARIKQPASRASDEKRLIMIERYARTSPFRSPEAEGSKAGLGRGLTRRRELSVPLLSQTLSHFSLSQSPPNPSDTPSRSTSSTMPVTETPRRFFQFSSRTPTPSANLSRYPSTAPLPYTATFLGSPFSTARSTDQRFHELDVLPGSIGGSEWMVDAALDDLSDAEETRVEILTAPPRGRRDTSGSSSSVDDLYGSGASSSASLLSLSESHTRSSAVIVWSTDDEDALEITSISARRSPARSPLLRKTTKNPFEVGAKLDQPEGMIGLGILSSGSGDGLGKLGTSLSSNSSAELLSSSPSKPMSMRTSGNKFATTLPFSSISDIHKTSQAAPPQPRRKTLAGHLSAKMPSRIAPSSSVRPVRPVLRRGITEPRTDARRGIDGTLLSAETAYTPPPTGLFGDVKPSPAAFASTGLIKKRSGGMFKDVPKFHAAQIPAAPTSKSITKPQRGTYQAPDEHSEQGDAPPTDLVSNLVQAAQKTRGLRRKGSQMFASGSSGSIGDISKVWSASPATPTKPALATPSGLGITTPSPTCPENALYPFTISTATPFVAKASTPCVDEGRRITSVSSVLKTLGRSRHLIEAHGPIARASNPMLATTYKIDGGISDGIKGESSRLQRELEVVRPLGTGAFSQVWKVKDKAGKLWAVKANKPYTGAKNRLRQLEEVSILRSLSMNPHPNVIAFVDSWEHNRRLYLRTELADCGDLGHFLDALGDFGGLGEARVWKSLFELSGALQHVHDHNFLHLDVKPSNILITRTGHLKLADFGMSTISSGDGAAEASLSPALPQLEAGEFVWRAEGTMPSPIIDREVEGDREYLSPEALDGVVGRPADVFSLGILLLEAALNVVLPPNGEAWIKLRADDFSDLVEHYVPRDPAVSSDNKQAGGTVDVRSVEAGLPVLSCELLWAVKGLMGSDPTKRMSLEEVRGLEVMERSRQMGSKAALVEEDGDFLKEVLAKK